MTKINVGELFFSEPGTLNKYEVDLPVYEDNEFRILPGQKIKLEGYKIDKGISINTTEQKIKGKATCSRTLEEFTMETDLYPSEKQFYLKRPHDIEDDEEFDIIESKTMEIDVDDLLREAVFLGLPTVFISPQAENHGVNLVKEEVNKPFADLKKLIDE